MNASNLQKKIFYRENIISKVAKFNRKHKSLAFLGIAYAFCAIFLYNILFWFYRNLKRFTALACIIMFFIVSSSFSYPTSSLGSTFESELNIDEVNPADVTIILDDEVAESDVELAIINDVDESVIEEAMVSENPDVAEAEHNDPEKQFSIDDIADTDLVESFTEDTDNGDSSVFSRDDWKLILVNKQHPIPDNYEFCLGTIHGSMRCDERVIAPLLEMMKAAKKDGVSLIICSPYRDMDRQTMLFTNKVNKYMEAGMSYMDAYNLASQAVTVPGSSEHQIGLAIDIITDGYNNLDEGFADTAAGKWLAENSCKYGFILRYPAGKEEITSIEYEPWHFRYVGVDAATFMTENGICLEEFWSNYVE